MKRFLNLLSTGALTLALVLAVSSCEKKEPSYGLTTVSVVTASGQSYNFTIDQTALKADNTADPVPIYTQDAVLKSCTVNVAATLDAVIAYKGATVTSGVIEGVDMTSPLSITVSFEEWTKTYTVTMVKGEVSADLQKGVRMSADFTKTGLPSNLTDYDVVYNGGKFYMNSCTYEASATEGEAGTAHYDIYTSIDGINWSAVSSDLKVIGAVGARAVALDGKVYVIGGCKTWGKDVEGNDPETAEFWGMTDYKIHDLKVFTS